MTLNVSYPPPLLWSDKNVSYPLNYPMRNKILWEIMRESDFHQGSPRWEQNSSSMWTVFSSLNFFWRGRGFRPSGLSLDKSHKKSPWTASSSQFGQFKVGTSIGLLSYRFPKMKKFGKQNILTLLEEYWKFWFGRNVLGWRISKI